MDTICGYLERITYHDQETNFVVARLQEKGKKELTTIVGNLAGLNPGESLRLRGKWVQNKKFGRQFQVEKYEITVPATINGIEKYLGSGLIKGIGPIMARRIVRTFNLDTLDIIENSPQELSRVEGIGPKRIAMISKAWEEQKEIKDIMMFLQDHGISAAYSAKIYKQYGRASIQTVKTNPYRLAADIRGIGFLTADRIARTLGVDPNSIMRAEEGTLYVLNSLMDAGHVYYPYEALVDKVVAMLDVDRDIVVKAIAGLFISKRIVLEDLNELPGSLQPNNKAVYLAPFHLAENALARRLLALNLHPSGPGWLHTAKTDNLTASLGNNLPANQIQDRATLYPKIIAWVEHKLGIQLAEKQKEAVLLALQHKVLVITGGPGTGKTTIIRAIIQVLRALRLRILLAAPTGRAAKRMQEATGHEAKTIHRLLEFSPQKGGFQRDRDHPLEADAVIVDEASMIDTILMHHLLKAIPQQAAFILVGDINQLPSVGPGNVLRDIIASGRFAVVTLADIFRQSRESRIVVNAHLINRGQFPATGPPSPGGREDFYFIEEKDPERVLAKIIQLCRERIPKHFGLHPLRDIQVLTPMYKGLIGVENLNAELQQHLNPHGFRLLRGGKSFKVNDKVIQLVNNYEKEVFNGDIGRVASIDQEDQELMVDFDGRVVTYDFSELDELSTAYAISIHKSQGSEYPAVIIPVMMQHFMLLQRNLIYTAVTRGKKLVVLIGAKKALAIAITNNKPQERYTRLRERLVELES